MMNLKLLLIAQLLLIFTVEIFGHVAQPLSQSPLNRSEDLFESKRDGRLQNSEQNPQKGPRQSEPQLQPNRLQKRQKLNGKENPYLPFDPDRGYINIYNENNSMWYWHFKVRENPDSAPLMIFLNGGPGCPSTNSVFTPGGIFNFTNWPEGGMKAALRNITITQKVNILYPDFPLGVGFSTVTGDRVSMSGEQAQEQILIFFQNFLEKYPEYKGRPLIIMGVSFGGHWAPYAATALKYSGNPDINVQGLYISSGMMDSSAQINSLLEYGLKNSKYTKFDQKTVQEFTNPIDLCQHSFRIGKNPMHIRNAFHLCWKDVFHGLVDYSTKLNKEFSPYYLPGYSKLSGDSSYMDFLNNRKAQEYLRVRKHDFESVNNTFLNMFLPRDYHVDMKHFVARLLNDGVKTLIVAGNMDLITNYVMSERVTSAVKWRHQKEFNKVERAPCKHGLCKEFQNLREIRVFGAGHGYSLYKPEYAMEIVSAYFG